jgi:hypothetical protein
MSTYFYVLGSSYGFVSSFFFAKKGANPTVDGEKKDDPPPLQIREQEL